MSATRRRYTDDDRATALAALAANAGNLRRTARQLGVPETTLRQWAAGSRHPEAAGMSALKKGPMADALESVAWKLLDALPGKIDKAPLNHTAVALGIAVEKMRLLREQPTAIARGELADVPDDELDAHIRRLEADLRPPAHPADAGAAGAGPGGPAGGTIGPP